MPRLIGVDIPHEKRIVISLQYIYGIGKKSAFDICKKAGVELVTHLEAPTIEAYTRLRAAEAMTAAGNHTDARGHLEPALAFYRSVGATRYIREAESLLATSA